MDYSNMRLSCIEWKGCKEFGCNALSRKLGVSPAAIHHIVTGKSWGLV